MNQTIVFEDIHTTVDFPLIQSSFKKNISKDYHY